jgi:hypothetical protein
LIENYRGPSLDAGGKMTWEEASAEIPTHGWMPTLPELEDSSFYNKLPQALKDAYPFDQLQHADDECYLATTEDVVQPSDPTNNTIETFKKWLYIGNTKTVRGPPPVYANIEDDWNYSRQLHDQDPDLILSTSTTTTTTTVTRHGTHVMKAVSDLEARLPYGPDGRLMTAGDVLIENELPHIIDRQARTACIAYFVDTPLDHVGRPLGAWPIRRNKYTVSWSTTTTTTPHPQ